MTDQPRLIDPRGPRFGAVITTVLLALAIALGPRWGALPLVIALAAFAMGAFGGLALQPWGIIFRAWVRPRLGAPAELEDERPPRFAQLVGFLFAVTALLGVLLHVAPLFYTAAGLALLAAALNAVFNFCLGCEIWTLWQRARHRATAG